MANKQKLFNNPELNKAVEKSMHWLDKWQAFEASVQEDIKGFEELLNQKQIPIVTWVQIDETNWLGWAPSTDSEFMGLHFKCVTDDVHIKPLKDCELEQQMMAFPYLSELSFQICARIKLAHTPNRVLEEFAGSFLSPDEEEEVAPMQIATYT